MRKLFPKNIDTWGRWLRLTMGILLLGIAYCKMSWIILAFAVFVIFEALMSWCVVYHILGKTSCSIKKKR